MSLWEVAVSGIAWIVSHAPPWTGAFDAPLQRVGDQHQHLRILIKQQHDSKVTQPFVSESRTCNELQAFNLSKVRGIAEHVNVEQLRDIVMASKAVFLLEGCPYSC